MFCPFKNRLMPGTRATRNASLMRSWLSATICGAIWETIRLTVPSIIPNPVNCAWTTPTRTVITSWAIVRLPFGKVLNWAVPTTSTVLTFILMFPFPLIGSCAPAIKTLVEWVPTMFIRGIFMVNRMIKPFKEKSKAEKQKLWSPVTSAFLKVKSTLKVKLSFFKITRKYVNWQEHNVFNKQNKPAKFTSSGNNCLEFFNVGWFDWTNCRVRPSASEINPFTMKKSDEIIVDVSRLNAGIIEHCSREMKTASDGTRNKSANSKWEHEREQTLKIQLN